MGRKRNLKNRDLPEHLYQNRYSFIYKRAGHKPTGLGNDRKTAISVAKRLNEMYSTDSEKALIEKFKRRSLCTPGEKPVPGSLLFRDVAEKYWSFYLNLKEPKASTMKVNRQRKNRLVKRLGDMPIETIETFHCAQVLTRESQSEYSKSRSVLIGIMRYAKEQGWYSNAIPNPAYETTPKTPSYEKKRKRLTVEQYKEIYKRAPVWLQVLMAIALQTLLRRFDLVNLRLDDSNPNYFIRDGFLYVVPEKSNTKKRKKGKSYICWDISQNSDLAKAINKAKELSLKHGRCPFVISRLPKKISQAQREAKRHHAQVLPEFATNKFREIRQLVIDETDLFQGYEKGELPGIHEIRSLGSHLMKLGGAEISEVQELMAHTDEALTEHYQSGHNIPWKQVKLKVSI